jgi:hypothetical protein
MRSRSLFAALAGILGLALVADVAKDLLNEPHLVIIAEDDATALGERHLAQRLWWKARKKWAARRAAYDAWVAGTADEPDNALQPKTARFHTSKIMKAARSKMALAHTAETTPKAAEHTLRKTDAIAPSVMDSATLKVTGSPAYPQWTLGEYSPSG